MPNLAKFFFELSNASSTNSINLTNDIKKVLLLKFKQKLNPRAHIAENNIIDECKKFKEKDVIIANFYNDLPIIVLQVKNDPKIINCIQKIYNNLVSNNKKFKINISKQLSFILTQIQLDDIIENIVPNIPNEPLPLGEKIIWNTLKHNGPYFKYISTFTKPGTIDTQITETYNFLNTKLFIKNENVNATKLTNYGRDFIELNAVMEQYAILFGNELISGKMFGYEFDDTLESSIRSYSEGKYNYPFTLESIKPFSKDVKKFLNNFFYGNADVKGFLNYLKDEFPAFSSIIGKKYNNIIWNDIIVKILDNKLVTAENRKNIDKEIKRQEEAISISDKYGTCIIEGRPTNITSYNAPLAQIFKGRNQKFLGIGLIKPRVLPEDISINANVQIDPPIGYSWAAPVKSYNFNSWLWRWIDPISKQYTYAYLPEGSSYIKVDKAIDKFDIARKLNAIADSFKMSKIELPLATPGLSTKSEQILVALYLLFTQGFRIDSDSGDATNEAVGLCGLTLSNLNLLNTTNVKQAEMQCKKILKNSNLYIYTTLANQLDINADLGNQTYKFAFFKFPGKDQVMCYRNAQISSMVWNILKKLIKNKNQTDRIFDEINAKDVNKWLEQNCKIKGVSARSFRTQIASRTMFNYLFSSLITTKNQLKRKVSLTNADLENTVVGNKVNNILQLQKRLAFQTANLEVAKILNHKSTVSETRINSFIKNGKKLTELIDKTNTKLLTEKDKTTIKYKKILLDKILLEIKYNLYKNIDEATSTAAQGYSLNTSLKNYIDPRIVVSWCKKYDIPLSSATANFNSATTYIYTKEQQRADFAWAINITPSMSIWQWDFAQTKIINVLCSKKQLVIDGEVDVLNLFNMLYAESQTLFNYYSKIILTKNINNIDKKFIENILYIKRINNV
jgi:DNA topoisomerase-1